MGADQENVKGFKHACTNVKKCKEENPKQSQVKSTLGIVVTIFGTKVQAINAVKTFAPNIPLEMTSSLHIKNGLVFSIWS